MAKYITRHLKTCSVQSHIGGFRALYLLHACRPIPHSGYTLKMLANNFTSANSTSFCTIDNNNCIVMIARVDMGMHMSTRNVIHL